MGNEGKCKHRNGQWCNLDDNPCYGYINGLKGKDCPDYEEVKYNVYPTIGD